VSSSRENVVVEVRPARIGDERAIAEVHVHTWQAAYRGQVPDAFLDSLSIERRTQRWSQIISQSAPPAGVFVLEDDGQVVGFAHVAGWELDEATKVDKRDGFQLHELRYRRDLLS
jgi:hypothetical protein